MKKTSDETFWPKVDPHGPVAHDGTRCWVWTGARSRGGYGRTGARRPGWRGAHRVAYTLTFGEIPDGLHVLHACDNPACVNPAHLFLGDDEANVRDCVEKGRRRYVSAPTEVKRATCAGPKLAAIQSRFRGVSWHKRSRRWRAQAVLGGRQIHLGHFDTEEEARDVYLGFTRGADALMGAHRHEIER